MKKIGIVCEYNPFHNGHVYHIQKIKEMFPDSMLVCVMSGNFTERGEVSVIDKWEKTKLALQYGIDLVIELPFAFASQSADLFCKGSIEILEASKVDMLIFGSECNDIEYLKTLAGIQMQESYQKKVKEEMNLGNNYPTAMAKAFSSFIKVKKLGPNDTLGIGYIRELKKHQSKIVPICIQRTNDYHEKKPTGSISSASAIRTLLKEKKEVQSYLPYDISPYKLHFNEDYFPYLKYKILSETDLSRYHGVEEGIQNRIQKYILKAKNYDELLELLKTKRYTYHKLSRMLIHILVGFTKEEANSMKEIAYLRILGFNKKGSNYLKNLKKECKYPIYSTYKKDPMLELEGRTTFIYDGSFEYQEKVIKE